MTNPPHPRPTRGELILVILAAAAASLTAILWSWHLNAFLFYGDAEAHTHIARRLFDSHRPGITQLGSVWLPLSHLLMVPFVAIDPWWRSGFAAVIPSALCYLLACLGLYRLARNWLPVAPAILALSFFAANPNLLYLQTTAMTEPLFLAELIWSILLLVEWYQSLNQPGTHSQWAVIAVLIAAVYTRYDGWILAFLAWAAMAACLYRRRRLFEKQFLLASILLALAPAAWMAYNAVVFNDWLDFMRGPYSARAIELRTASSATAPHPGWHNPWLALQYFLKAAEMDATAARQWGGILFAAAIFGTGCAWFRYGRKQTRMSDGFITHSSNHASQTWSWTILLWLPLPFYAYSVSYGSVPIFVPTITPFSYYNTRYGMELLPAFALFLAFAAHAGLTRIPSARYRHVVTAILLTSVAINTAAMLRQGPLTYVEGEKNTLARNFYNSVLPSALRTLLAQNPQAIVLMNTSTYPSVIPHAGLTYRQTINESDKEFYWAALGAPSAHASIILAFAGDDIDKAVHLHPEHLRKVATYQSPNKGWDQPDATLYVTDTQPLTTPMQPAPASPAQ